MTMDDDTPRLWPKVLCGFLAAMMVLSMVHSAALQTAAYDLPEGAWSEQVIAAAETWHSWMEQGGIAMLTEESEDLSLALHEATIAQP